MVSNQQNLPSHGKQFRLAKFFAYTSFTILIISSFPMSVLVSQQAKDLLMKSYENYAFLIGENLNYQVFQNFVIPVTRRFGKVRLRDKEQYEWTDKIVRNTTHSFKLDIVNIYDIGKGVIAYSTDSRLLGKKVKKCPGYQKAVNGESFSGFISDKDDLWGLGIEMKGGGEKLRTFIPFRGVDPFGGETSYVLGVFELIQDFTNEYEDIVRLQYFIFILSILIMGLIFIALFLIVHKAEMIIEERAKEQRELESQLNQAERLAALGQMVSGVSHEIRNPLGIIRSTAELLGEIPGSDEAHKKLSLVIIEESSRLNNIVTEFLDFARPTEPDLLDCCLEEMINKNLNFLGPELDKRKISVNNNLNDRSFKLKADPQLLYTTFLNIFVNAIQSMKNGGEITVSLEEEKNDFIIKIADTGCGISPANLSKVFNPFFSSKDEGSGLGLPIVRNIIEGHKGSIWIESKEGVGTEIFIKLPKG